MTPPPLTSWEEVGQRIAEARAVLGLTQEDLASAIGLDRTAVSKIESGRREVDSLELARLAEALDRPLAWFVTETPPALTRWRADNISLASATEVELILEDLARDIELLQDLGTLQEAPAREQIGFDSLPEAVKAAEAVREELGLDANRPVDLLDAAERLGLFVFVLPIREASVDGAYLALRAGAVSVVNGNAEPGRRRFTTAHEIGHLILQDEFTTDLAIGTSTDKRERLVDAFAVNFQLPALTVFEWWKELDGSERPRDAAITLAAEFRLSWTALCAHLRNVGVLEKPEHRRLVVSPPTPADWAELGLFLAPEREPPLVPKAFASAVVKAYKRYDVTIERAVELLRGTVRGDDLPVPGTTPMEALRSEL